MQFKYPEILWFLLLLLIPIIIHLFQLRRFKKTPFTNVAMLQRVTSESRKSNSLKKWLLLFTRLLLLACLILAFAQPFFAKSTALQTKETVIYLDDSFSMQATNDGISLLEKAVQDLVKNIPEGSKFSLFTNDRTFAHVELKQIQNQLITLQSSSKQLTMENVLLKANTLFSKDGQSLKNLILISDFQNRLGTVPPEHHGLQLHAVQLLPNRDNNVSIDSIALGKQTLNQQELKVWVSGLVNDESVPIALYNNDTPIAKTAVQSNGNPSTQLQLSIPAKTEILGRLIIEDNSLDYDNTFYFNRDKQPKIKVLAISGTVSSFLPRIYTDDEFEYSEYLIQDLNYSLLPSQNLIVLNDLKVIPTSLQTALTSFLNDGGRVVCIPSREAELSSYNSFLGNTMGIRLQEKIAQEMRLTNIAFDHPLFSGVFERKVNNFDYPNIASYYPIAGNASKILSFSNQQPFLVGNSAVYLFTAPLDLDNTNFQNSPLIVPTFYKMGLTSLKLPPLFFLLGDEGEVDVPTTLERDNIVKLRRNEFEFIPIQQSHPNKVSLKFGENLDHDGIYAVTHGVDTIQHISFNHNRLESRLGYLKLKQNDFSSIQNSIPTLFDNLNEDNSIDAYWKWFVIFALAFALVELLIQKFLA